MGSPVITESQSPCGDYVRWHMAAFVVWLVGEALSQSPCGDYVRWHEETSRFLEINMSLNPLAGIMCVGT